MCSCWSSLCVSSLDINNHVWKKYWAQSKREISVYNLSSCNSAAFSVGEQRRERRWLWGCIVFGIHGTAQDCCSQAGNNLSPSLPHSPPFSPSVSHTVALWNDPPSHLFYLSSSFLHFIFPLFLPTLLPLQSFHLSSSYYPCVSLCTPQPCGSHWENHLLLLYFIRQGVLASQAWLLCSAVCWSKSAASNREKVAQREIL